MWSLLAVVGWRESGGGSAGRFGGESFGRRLWGSVVVVRAALNASQAAAVDAKDAAGVIPIAARGDCDWEAMTTGTRARLAAAQSSARAAEDFAMEVFGA